VTRALDHVPRGTTPCGCRVETHSPKLVVLTGGPGAGKTAVLEMMRRCLCEHVVLLPEAATIVFGGGFPRVMAAGGRRAAQRAICALQRELEHLAFAEEPPCLVLCDRGTLDGLAYWTGGEGELLGSLGLERSVELARYHTVIHMRTPLAPRYETSNTLRIETVREAIAIDARIEQAWAGHPRRLFVDSLEQFDEKAMRASALIRAELPSCCGTRASDERRSTHR
jgi:predicted ATPase